MWELLDGPVSSSINGTEKSNIGGYGKSCQELRVFLVSVVAVAISVLALFE